MTALETQMREWLTSDDPVKRSHAAFRIARGFDRPPPPPPPLLARAANFAAAVVTHVATGMRKADPQTAAARLAVCAGCDQRSAGGTCAGCGCNLNIKASWLEQTCPLNRWPDPPDAPDPERPLPS